MLPSRQPYLCRHNPVNRTPNASPSRAASHARDEQGFIILGAIILLVLILVVGVMLGKVFRVQYPDSYIEARAARHHVVADTELRMGDRIVGRLRRGEQVWATRLENGDVAIATDSTGQTVRGFVGSSALTTK